MLIGGGGNCRSCIDVVESEGRSRIVGAVRWSVREGRREINGCRGPATSSVENNTEEVRL